MAAKRKSGQTKGLRFVASSGPPERAQAAGADRPGSVAGRGRSGQGSGRTRVGQVSRFYRVPCDSALDISRRDRPARGSYRPWAVAYIGAGLKWSVSRRVIWLGALTEGLRTAQFTSRSDPGRHRRTYATASPGCARLRPRPPNARGGRAARVSRRRSLAPASVTERQRRQADHSRLLGRERSSSAPYGRARDPPTQSQADQRLWRPSAPTSSTPDDRPLAHYAEPSELISDDTT